MKIASLEDEIAELEGTRVCAECGAKVEKKCGILQPVRCADGFDDICRCA